ncbi:MAG: NAD-binding protein [Planctomycetota bacterium]|nr:NAD-binding protein [Planctomycetota bacterium]
MVKRVIVLGAGMVGKTICKELSQNHQVLAIDLDPGQLQRFATDNNVATEVLNVSDKDKLRKIVADADLVVSAVLVV